MPQLIPLPYFCQLMCLVLLLVSSPMSDAAETPPNLTAPSPLDVQYLQKQRTSIAALFSRQLGRGLQGDTRDLESLQLLLDRHLVRRDDALTLQAMGIVMGDVLAKELDLHWIIYTDKLGRSRALQFRDSKEFVFPATLIARRYAAGASIDVKEIYDQVAAPIRPLASSDPFD